MTIVRTSTGNRCGHCPARPRLRLHRRPSHKFLATTADKIRAYYTRPGILPELGARRSERREALILVLCALVHFVDLRTMRVIVRPSLDDRVSGVDRRKLRTLTGLRLRRIDRALADLVAARLLFFDGQPVEEIAPARYIGYAAHRRFAVTLWGRLGLDVSLATERQRAAARHREAVRRREDAGTRAARRAMGRAFPVPGALAVTVDLPEHLQREIIAAIFRLKAAHPDWPGERIKAAAEAEVLRPR